MLRDIKKRFGEILPAFVEGNRDEKKAMTIIKETSLWNVSDESGNSLLHYAAENNKIDITQYLIESGSEVDAQNARGKTPLILAVEKRHAKIVEILLNAGANIDISDDSHRSVLQVIIDNIETMGDDIAQMILKKLKKDGCHDEDIGVRLLDAGWPIYCIIQLGNIQISRSLLMHECSVNFYFSHEYPLREIQPETGTVVWQNVYGLTQENACKLLQNMSRRALDIFPTGELNKETSQIDKFREDFSLMEKTMRDMDRLMDEWRDISDRPARNRVLSLETQYAVACAMDYVLNHDIELEDEVEIRKYKYDTFEPKTNVIYTFTFTKLDMIYQVIFKRKFFIFGELLLAFLAFERRSGKPFKKITRRTINSNDRLKNYFGFCQRLLAKEVYESVTLFQLLSENTKSVTYLIANQEFLKAMTRFDERLKSESYYFHILLQRRIERALGANVLCKLMHLNYTGFPGIAETILDYLAEEDVVALSKLRDILLPTSK